ncbi:MAG: aminotransferase class I/II-fold pyridoxal phosphate-dependent enzyme, partial [Mariprofundaceae bacterium]
MPDSRNWFPPVPPYRRRRLTGLRRDGVFVELDGRRLVNFASNDYLGLSLDPAVRRAAGAAAGARGFGSGGSRLISGDDPDLHALERDLAGWKGFEAALVVGSGMLANIGLLQALAARGDVIFADRLNHASLVDGARLARAAGARLRRFPHGDLGRLASLLAGVPARQRLVVSDGVFSMDGDQADAAGLLALARAHDALLVLDDAHGIGVLGPDGRGLSAAAGIAGVARLVEVGTFGKAFGGYGAFILGTQELVEGLRQRMRTLIYSTALPPAVIAANRAALETVRAGEARVRLQRNLALFR